MAEPDLHRRRRGLRALSGWPLPPNYAQASLLGLSRALETENGRRGFIRAFLDDLIQRREKLPVADLLTWIIGFGSSENRAKADVQS